MKLLIVDDDLTFRTMLSALTSQWGYEPIAFEDGEHAWQYLQKNNEFCLMLIDWEMPRLNGLELCKRIRREIKTTPPFIIFLASRSKTKDIVSALQAGANDYLSKPFDESELEARIMVGRRMLETQVELKKAQDIMTYERECIENIILKMRASKPFESKRLRTLDQPVEKTSGDIMLSAYKPDKTRHVLLGDFTGHGLMAAVGGPIVYDVFYTMTAKGLAIKEIANEINRQLLDKMPTGLFLGAIFIELSADGRVLTLWNCGMSDILIYRQSKLWKKLSSNMLALGILPQEFDPLATLDVESGDRVYAYSDGITEINNIDDEEFGQDRLESTISKMLIEDADISLLTNTITEFRGQSEQFDDVTLVELTC